MSNLLGISVRCARIFLKNVSKIRASLTIIIRICRKFAGKNGVLHEPNNIAHYFDKMPKDLLFHVANDNIVLHTVNLIPSLLNNIFCLFFVLLTDLPLCIPLCTCV